MLHAGVGGRSVEHVTHVQSSVGRALKFVKETLLHQLKLENPRRVAHATGADLPQ